MLIYFVILVDLLLLNAVYASVIALGLDPSVDHSWFFWNICYLVAVLAFHPIAHLRLVRIEKVASRVFETTFIMSLIFGAYIAVANRQELQFVPSVLMILTIFGTLFLSQLCCQQFFKHMRKSGSNNRKVLFVGAGHNLAYLYECMNNRLDAGYRVIGYFDDHASQNLPGELPLLGNVSDVRSWLESNPRPDMLFCNLPSSRSEEIVSLINYCDKHFIHFYSVPNVRNYIHRVMEVEMIDDMPVLSIRKDPLSHSHNRVLKRAFDLIVSGLFLAGCFWWIYLIVALITKITMPGPVFFKQKRNGLEGEEFWCLKFRSMKVNADADRLQATKDDPRKTKWGNIMRKTSIDE